MIRARRPSRQLNDKTLTVQVNVCEWEYLDGLSRLSGLPMSALLREIVRGFVAKEAPDHLLGRLEEA